jgi:hypothetical protein
LGIDATADKAMMAAARFSLTRRESDMAVPPFLFPFFIFYFSVAIFSSLPLPEIDSRNPVQ